MMPANLYPKDFNRGRMEVTDAYWKKRKQKLEKMLEQFQQTGWKTGGFNIHNCDSLRRRLYQDNKKYSKKIAELYDTSLSDGAVDLLTPLGQKYGVLPSINHRVGSTEAYDYDDLSSPVPISEISKYNDVFRRSGADVTYVRRYAKDGEVIVLRSLQFDPQAKVGSLDNAEHQPGGGDVKLIHKPLDVSSIKAKVGSLDNFNHKPKGGKRKILHRDVHWKASSKIGSLDNMDYQPSAIGKDPKSIYDKKPEWHSQAKIGSLDNIGHIPSRSFRTLQDYMSPFRQRLLGNPRVIWTEGYNQDAISKPLKRLKPLADNNAEEDKNIR